MKQDLRCPLGKSSNELVVGCKEQVALLSLKDNVQLNANELECCLAIG